MNELHPTLQVLLDLAEMGASAPVTLTVGGSVFTGELMREADYVEAWLKDVTDAFRRGNVGQFADKIDQKKAGIVASIKKTSQRSHLFLCNARLFHSGALRTDGGNWCIRADAVDAVAFGSLRNEE